MKSKRVAILQSNYIPWKGYFDLINSVDEFIFYDCVQYTKHDWRNRNKIKTAAGSKWLTIPVTTTDLFTSTFTVAQAQIADPQWRKKHWSSISQNYSKARYFADYSKVFQSLYEDDEVFLSKINQRFIKTICQVLDIRTKITDSTEYELVGDRNERLVNLCQQAGAGSYLSGPAAQDYLDESLFANVDVAVKWMDYSNYPEYTQLFPPFDHYVTVLDLIFNEGPNAQQFMKSFQRTPSQTLISSQT
jgi:hypothetical protein